MSWDRTSTRNFPGKSGRSVLRPIQKLSSQKRAALPEKLSEYASPAMFEASA